MERIRYKYRKAKEGVSLEDVNCPVCGSNHINSIKVVQNKEWNGTIILLAECWSGNTYEDKPNHLFYIEIEDLPTVKIEKVEKRRRKPKQKRGSA